MLNNIRYFAVLAILLLMVACAKIGSPTGGERDLTPPTVLYSNPPNKQLGFTTNSIEIFFDEFVQVKNVKDEVVVSPPSDNTPDIILKGKSIKIVLNDTLKPNTTYIIDFGNSIVDNNEGNVLENYKYIFSTGASLDSLALSGKVLNSFDLTVPKEKCIVMLYPAGDDSAIYKNIPSYITKLNTEGGFFFSNLKNGQYNVFALVDDNKNLKYDVGEAVAFCDTALLLDERYYMAPDTIFMIDSTIKNVDSIAQLHNLDNDTMMHVHLSDEIDKHHSNSLSFYVFQEKPLKGGQYIKSYKRLSKEFLYVAYNNPLPKPVSINILDSTDNNQWGEMIYSASMDSFGIWIADTLISNKEKIKLSFVYPSVDSLGNPIDIADTLSFISTEKRRKPITVSPILASLNSSSIQDLNKKVVIKTSIPTSKLDVKKLTLQRTVDTVKIVENVNIIPIYNLYNPKIIDSIILDFKLQEASDYELLIEKGAFESLLNVTNDSLVLKVKTQQLDFYSKIILSLSNMSGDMVIQLIDTKETVIKEQSVNVSTPTVTFDYLYPAEYKIKAFYDANNNGKWDTGDLLNKIQPEKIVYLEGIIKARENWDVEQKWMLP